MSPADTSIAADKLRVVFALLFSAPEPVSLERIREVLYLEPEQAGAAETASPREHLAALETWMAGRELPLRLQRVGAGYRLLTTDDVAPALESVRKQVQKERVGPAALEVLALVAYRQPVLKADMDAIRGVNSANHLRNLLDLRLIRILGRAELPGRPFLYATTQEFLDRFGLRDLKDLPEAGRLAAPAEAEPAAAEAASATAPDGVEDR